MGVEQGRASEVTVVSVLSRKQALTAVGVSDLLLKPKSELIRTVAPAVTAGSSEQAGVQLLCFLIALLKLSISPI